MTDTHKRITGSTIMAKSFSTKARRGYDPDEVDAFLLEIADYVDTINDELEMAKLQLHSAQGLAEAAPPPPPPPPPVQEVAPEPAPVPEPVVAAAPEPTRSLAEQESVEMILRMAQKSAEEALAEAHSRADEIVAEANFRAAQIGRDADRKAFETASRTQEELRAIEAEISQRQVELDAINAEIARRQHGVRGIADELLGLADRLGVPQPEVVDLTDTAQQQAAPATPDPVPSNAELS